MPGDQPRTLTARQAAAKRVVDVVLAGAVLVVTSPLMVLGWAAATLETRQNGLFRQVRIGRDGAPFEVMKLRSMRCVEGLGTTVTTRHDVRITRSGAWLRRLKIDELPQLVNVLRGEMSLVGPRPDVPGFADRLEGGDRVILSVRPGITGPATLAYRHEEAILAEVPDPERYNREVIWPDKVRLNRQYVEQYRLRSDLTWLVRTVRSVSEQHESTDGVHR
jgi:lipopolysaccharide/colanic/teichoic acid biosynthesis glycosyltransferase